MLSMDNIPDQIRAWKLRIEANAKVDYQDVFDRLTEDLRQEIDVITALKAQGQSPIPELAFDDVANAAVSEEAKALIRQRGCVVIRDVFPDAQAEQWGDDIRQYIDAINYLEQPDKGLDQYFASLQSAKPQIYSIYWSPAQIAARQAESMAVTKRFLNRLWKYQTDAGDLVFDPDRECTYADRTRRREPGDQSLGLAPHMDGGSVERWLDEPGFNQVYRHLLSGEWQRYDPYEAEYRVQTTEILSPAVCSMFRTFQGWTALSKQGPGDGTLQLIPIARGIAWMFLRALQPDVADGDLCGAEPARALKCVPEWHDLMLEALTSIPVMHPGDTVWWHPDVVHAVEDAHTGKDYSNVIYIGAAPDCQKNRTYLPKQWAAFTSGKSAPDFAPEHYEQGFPGRAKEIDLSRLGKLQMCIERQV